MENSGMPGDERMVVALDAINSVCPVGSYATAEVLAQSTAERIACAVLSALDAHAAARVDVSEAEAERAMAVCRASPGYTDDCVRAALRQQRDRIKRLQRVIVAAAPSAGALWRDSCADVLLEARKALRHD